MPQPPDEVAALKRALAESRRELARAWAASGTLERQLTALRGSVSYRIADALKAAASPRGLLRLPLSLGRLYAEGRRRARARRAAREAALALPSAPLSTPGPAPTPAYVSSAPLPQTAPPRRQSNRAPGARGLRVAAIFDDFTAAAFRPEADFTFLTPENWEVELAAARPDLVLIESAWRGQEERWKGKIDGNADELRGILGRAKAAGVPTAFWNKEDPVNFRIFLDTARGFDHVFTTDLDCIQRYRAALGHDRVHLLPFACQPALHNPLETFARKDAMSFAGAYYRSFAERRRDFETFFAALPAFRPVEIFDRNLGKNRRRRQFPPRHAAAVVGTLPPEEIGLAYKGYRYAISLNSVKQSQTMFARRVCEILACNTPLVSNYSRGLRLMFGDLVTSTDDGPALLARIRALAADPDRAARIRLMALRKVMQEHTYGDRLDFVCAQVLADPPSPWRPPRVVALAGACDAAAAERIAQSFLAQSHAASRLVLVADHPVPAHPRIETRARGSLGDLCLAELAGPADWLACLSAADHYGPHYLTDLILTTRYSPATLIGKAAHFVWNAAAGPIATDPGRAYLPMPSCPVRRAILRGDCLPPRLGVATALAGLDTLRWERPDGVATDPWHYAAGGAEADPTVLRARIEDPADVDPGLPLAAFQAAAMTGPEEAAPPGIAAEQLADLFQGCAGREVALQAEADALVVTSDLGAGARKSLHARRPVPIRDVLPEGAANDLFRCHLQVEERSMRVDLALGFLAPDGGQIGQTVVTGNGDAAAAIPPGTAFVRLGLRAGSAGTARVRRLHLAHLHSLPAVILTRGAHLLVTGDYPSYEDPRRHRDALARVQACRALGLPAEVFCLRTGTRATGPLEGREFEGVDVLTGDRAALDRLLAGGRVRSLLAHDLTPGIWRALAPHLDRMPVTVQVDRIGTEPAFWRGVLDPMHPNLRPVFVSQSAAEAAMAALGIALPHGGYGILGPGEAWF